jgi:hypothetical protein
MIIESICNGGNIRGARIKVNRGGQGTALDQQEISGKDKD